MTDFKWSALYLDYITHYGDESVLPYRRATVCKIADGWYQLKNWSNNCGYSPEKKDFDTIEEAKKHGEAWVNQGK